MLQNYEMSFHPKCILHRRQGQHNVDAKCQIDDLLWVKSNIFVSNALKFNSKVIIIDTKHLWKQENANIDEDFFFYYRFHYCSYFIFLAIFSLVTSVEL